VYGVDATRLGRSGGGGGREVREGWRVRGMVAGGLERGGGGGEGGERVEEGEEEEEEEEEGDGGEEAGRRAGEVEKREIGKGRGPGWDKIVFNFPHVGGKTKDVNRQVRYNQGSSLSFPFLSFPSLPFPSHPCLPFLSNPPSPIPSSPAYAPAELLRAVGAELLVSFFKAAMPLLAPPSSPPTGTDPSSAIVVTLFDGEPYTLWNIRDLARHVGLKVSRSFKFQSSAYPGYRHARTLGNVGGVVGGGAWRGEERAARTYVFEVDGGDRAGARGRGNGSGDGVGRGKRKRGGSEEDEDD